MSVSTSFEQVIEHLHTILPFVQSAFKVIEADGRFGKLSFGYVHYITHNTAHYLVCVIAGGVGREGG